MGLIENARSRIPSLRQFWLAARRDRRRVIYDLLPIAATPHSRDRLARVAALWRPHTSRFAPSATARQWHTTLCEDGIVTDLPPVPQAIVAEIRSWFEGLPCRDPYRPHLGTFPFDRPPSDESNMGFYTAPEILGAPHVLEILNDPEILQVAELYLGCKPLLDNIACWWSFGGRPAAKGTQRYHRDIDSLRGFKQFIHLTPVGLEDGPHHFMAGSHRSPMLPTGKAMPDDIIHATFGADNERIITGPAGTRFLADTFGWHKGGLPQSGRRLILVAQYNVNATPHLPKDPFLVPPRPGYDPDINRLVLLPAGKA
jgi:hypothetical protein